MKQTKAQKRNKRRMSNTEKKLNLISEALGQFGTSRIKFKKAILGNKSIIKAQKSITKLYKTIKKGVEGDIVKTLRQRLKGLDRFKENKENVKNMEITSKTLIGQALRTDFYYEHREQILEYNNTRNKDGTRKKILGKKLGKIYKSEKEDALVRLLD